MDLKRKRHKSGTLADTKVEKSHPLAAPGQQRLIADRGPDSVRGLLLRVTSTARSWALRYTVDGQRRQLHLGDWSPAGEGGLNRAQAREAARARKAQKDPIAVRDEQRVVEAAKAGTLGALLDSYVEHLKERPSAKDARNIFKHVPADARARDANSISADDISTWMRPLCDRGVMRTAGKLRSYISSAYQVAAKAAVDPRLPKRAATMAAIASNPARLVPAWSSGERKRSLSDEELRAFLVEVRRIPERAVAQITRRPGRRPADEAVRIDAARLHAECVRDAILLALYIGGQRIQQMLRAKVSDVRDDAVLLSDPKGRNGHEKPRAHLVPIVGEAVQIVARRKAAAAAGSLFDYSPVRKPLRHDDYSKAVCAISKDLVARQAIREPFQAQDIRRTCETLLARLGVTKDIRARVLSHGLGGVQARYDMHEYADEKRNALERLAAHIGALESMPKVEAPGEIIDVFCPTEAEQKRADHIKRRINAGKRVSKRDLETAA